MTLKNLINTLYLFCYWGWLEIRSLAGHLRSKSTMSEMPHVSLLTYDLPPQFNSGTHRPLSFLRYAKENGWFIDAITNTSNKKPNEAGLQLEKELPNDIKIVRFNNDIGETSWQLTPKLDGKFTNALALIKAGINVFKTKRPDVILASCPPFYFAVAGYFLSRIFNIPLVLDYRDEWTLCPFDFVSKTRFDAWFERRCITQASLVLYTTESHLKHHSKHFSLSNDKQALIFNGWDNNGQSQPVSTSPVSSHSDIVISYIGRLSGHVDITSFLNTLQQVLVDNQQIKEKVIVNFIGEKNEEQAKQLANYVENKALAFSINCVDLVPKPQALSYMLSSTYLLMLCNRELSSYIPGKLYDYLFARKPVISYGFEGEVSNILQQIKMGCHVNQGDRVALEKALSLNLPTIQPNDEFEQWLSQRSRESQAKNLFSALTNRLSHHK